MKILMIAVNNIESSSSLGVTKKLIGEYHAFQKLDIDAYFLTHGSDGTILLHGNEQRNMAPAQINGYVGNIKLFAIAPMVCGEYGIDLCYIRYPLADWAFMRMIRRLHKLCKVYVEIPTYPYDKENKRNKNIVAQANFLQDRLNRKRIHKFVDRIVTFSDDREIYGVPCVNISNGIDVDAVKYVGDELDYTSDVNLISVALMRLIHGYDRVIEGLREYYSTGQPGRIVRYHVVGSGSSEAGLKELVNTYGLEEYVTFWGIKSGNELDELFRRSGIGIAVLGGHREGHDRVSDLKSREYCARGVPFITANRDRSFDGTVDFVKMMPMSDDPINIDEVVDYFDYIKDNPQIHMECRKYAEDNFSWEQQLKKVLLSALESRK